MALGGSRLSGAKGRIFGSTLTDAAEAPPEKDATSGVPDQPASFVTIDANRLHARRLGFVLMVASSVFMVVLIAAITWFVW